MWASEGYTDVKSMMLKGTMMMMMIEQEGKQVQAKHASITECWEAMDVALALRSVMLGV